MKRLDAEVIDYYDMEVVRMLMEKYGMTAMDALRKFTQSQTHRMLEEVQYGMTEFGAGALLDIWENEQVTGDPRTSVYIRGE